MTDRDINCGDRFGLVDRVYYAFNAVKSLRFQMMQNEDKVDEKICELSQEIKALTNLVHELREIISPPSPAGAIFIDDEALEVDTNEIDDQGDEDPEVQFIGTTVSSTKKRRLE